MHCLLQSAVQPGATHLASDQRCAECDVLRQPGEPCGALILRLRAPDVPLTACLAPQPMSSAIPTTQTQIVLLRRPKGPIDPSLSGQGTFGLQTSVPVPTASSLAAGEALIAVEYLSLDPAMRGWLNDARSYIAPVEIGAVMRAGGIGRVVALGAGGDEGQVRVGDWVNCTPGWQQFAVVPTKECIKLAPPPGVQLSWYLGTLGMPGQTAYWGLLDVAHPRPGELVVVTGAAGAVGSLVCQIAKIKGCRVVGIAGGEDKCHWLREELGVEAIDYKSSSFVNEFKKIGYLDVMFDNVGGEILNLALTRLKKGARIALCGAIADYK